MRRNRKQIQGALALSVDDFSALEDRFCAQ